MLCGQGSSGKSTFGSYLHNNLNRIKVNFIQVDRIVGTSELTSQHIDEYIYQLQDSIDKDISLIADFSHDSANSRAAILNRLILSNNKNIHFITVSIRPAFDTLIAQDVKRRNITINKEYLKQMDKIYNHFEFPTNEEFNNYDFLSISHFIVTNENDYCNVMNFFNK
jgi:hypothetical protein